MEKYLKFETSDNFKKDIELYFLSHGKLNTYEHTLNVVQELHNIEKQFGSIERGSIMACYCHDLGRVVEEEEMMEFCIENKIEITDEEKQLPSILHKKISRFIAENVFEINDKHILDAIRYHTTSRKQPSNMEIEVILADKLSWKEDGYREIANNIREAMKYSKEKAILYYLTYLESNKEEIQLYHMDSKEAYEYWNKSTRIH